MPCTSTCHKPRGRQCHCGVCHKSFSGIRTFDIHRREGTCNLVSWRLTEKNGVWGFWGTMTEADRLRIRGGKP